VDRDAVQELRRRQGSRRRRRLRHAAGAHPRRYRLLPPFDPRPYPAAWFLHRDEEKFLGWIKDGSAASRSIAPRVGDCLVYRFGRASAMARS
jgi:hypothetical protein